ncbi:MAG: heme exporter protein CcmD [Pseudomonadota bacterium]|nr:heme exporter protein CcmD [Pseudomonadota bacterium]
MNHWAFITAAYGVTIVAMAVLILWAYRSMRRAEAAADELRRR